MKKALLVAAIALAPALAWAQAGGPFVAPGLQYYAGPSAPMVWERADAFIGGVNAQVGTTYTMLSTDRGLLLTFNNASAVAVTLPAATTSRYGVGSHWSILNLGAGTVTVTPTTSAINGASTKTYAQNASGQIVSDGTNYFAY